MARVSTYVNRLRQKIEDDPSDPQYRDDAKTKQDIFIKEVQRSIDRCLR